ncbi:hypothetical protein [Acidovorax sp. FG27]|uniref:hypothetical protein n=1 Tax=Acidovorax sp. FG27 TaxID=3133652 RepID=UPI0030E7539B
MNFFKAFLAVSALLAALSGQSIAQEGPFHTKSGSATYHTSEKKALRAAGLEEYVNKENTSEIDGFVRNRAKIEALNIESFAGGWIEYDANLKAQQVFAFAGQDNPIRNVKLEGKLSFIAVKFSLKQLKSLREQIFKDFEHSENTANQLIFGIGIDEKANKLLISAREENHNL